MVLNLAHKTKTAVFAVAAVPTSFAKGYPSKSPPASVGLAWQTKTALGVAVIASLKATAACFSVTPKTAVLTVIIARLYKPPQGSIKSVCLLKVPVLPFNVRHLLTVAQESFAKIKSANPSLSPEQPTFANLAKPKQTAKPQEGTVLAWKDIAIAHNPVTLGISALQDTHVKKPTQASPDSACQKMALAKCLVCSTSTAQQDKLV